MIGYHKPYGNLIRFHALYATDYGLYDLRSKYIMQQNSPPTPTQNNNNSSILSLREKFMFKKSKAKNSGNAQVQSYIVRQY